MHELKAYNPDERCVKIGGKAVNLNPLALSHRYIPGRQRPGKTPLEVARQGAIDVDGLELAGTRPPPR